jgi:hypothetical protein
MEVGFKSRGWRIMMRVSVTAELPLDDNGCSDQETRKNLRQDRRYQPLSQIEWLAGHIPTAHRVAGVQISQSPITANEVR